MPLKSREGKLPPANYYAQIFGHLTQAYPAAQITPATMASLKPAWDMLWQAGRPADVVAKTTCSCDGKHITLSPAFAVTLPKGAYRGPKGAERGALFDPASMRESAPVERTRRSYERVEAEIQRAQSKVQKIESRATSSKNAEKQALLRQQIEDQLQSLAARQAEAAQIGRRLADLRASLGTAAFQPQLPVKSPQAAPPKEAKPRAAKKAAAGPKAPPKADKVPAAPAATKPAPQPVPQPASAAPVDPDQAILAKIQSLLPALAAQLAGNLKKAG